MGRGPSGSTTASGTSRWPGAIRTPPDWPTMAWSRCRGWTALSISEPPTQTGQLSVHAPGARIKVLDAFLRPVEGGAGTDTVTAHLTPGAYRVIARIGEREVSQPVLIRAGGEPRVI